MADKKIKYDINESEQPFMSADDFDGSTEEEIPAEQNEVFISRLAGLVQEKFDSAERGRQDDEERWLNAYHNYRGIYNKNVKFKENEKSKSMFEQALKIDPNYKPALDNLENLQKID